MKMNKHLARTALAFALGISVLVPTQSQAAKPSLLIWSDSVRSPGHSAYAKLHPEYKIKIENQGAALLSKIQLFNRVKKGWPDMYFEPDPNKVAIMQAAQFGYAAPLNKYFPASYWKSFGTANDWCKINGKYYCVKNDLAQTVLYYDQKLFDQFGYKVPTTMDEFRTIALDLAKNHPGYNVGSLGSHEMYQGFLWPSGCQMAQAVKNKLISDPKNAKCTRVIKMIQELIDAGVLLRSSAFSADVQKANQAGKMLMNIGPSWWGDYVISPEAAFGVPAGRINIAPTPKWPGETKNWSGAWGGGVFMISAHSKFPQIAADMIRFNTSDPKFVVSESMVTYPGFPPAANRWLKNVVAKDYYVDSAKASKTLYDSSLLIRGNVTPVRFDVNGFVESMGAEITGGKSVQDAFNTFIGKIDAAATLAGYEVTTK
jgi:multiple sugar transport system substrate-binding protein